MAGEQPWEKDLGAGLGEASHAPASSTGTPELPWGSPSMGGSAGKGGLHPSAAKAQERARAGRQKHLSQAADSQREGMQREITSESLRC